MKASHIIFAMVIILAIASAAGWSADMPKRFQVRSVSMTGNEHFETDRIKGFMLTHPSRFMNKVYFYPEVLSDDLANIKAFYRQNGYLQADITDTSISYDSAARKVDVAFTLSEGQITLIEGITIFGSDFFSDSTVRSFLSVQMDDPLRRRSIQEGIMNILGQYAEHGYLDAAATPDVKLNDESHRAMIDIFITEGNKSSADSIVVNGLEKTNRNVVIRELLFKRGQTIQYSKLLKSQRQLYLTGLFESVFIKPVPPASGEPGKKDIQIDLKERQSGDFGVMVGYGTIEKLRGRIELNTNNLAGTARKAGAQAEANYIKQNITGSFSEPWTLGTRWRTDINGFLEFRQEPSYDLRSYGFITTLGRPLWYHTNINISYKFSNNQISHVTVDSAITELNPRIRSLSLSIIHDSRDNLFNPTSGTYATWTNELAGSFLQGTNTFGKSTLQLKYFRRISRETVFASALEIGILAYLGSDEEIPLNERFFTGGPTSIRGLGYQLAGPLDTANAPLGGNFKLVWNVCEIRQTVYKIFGIAGFVDMGNVWSQAEDFHLKDIRVSVGGGLRLSSPIGLLRLDAAAIIDARKDEDKSRIFIGIGQAF